MAQLCGRLLELVRGLPVEPDGSVELQPSLTQQEMADWLGVSRDAVVIALQRLRRNGLVETGRRRIRIVDPGPLRRDPLSSAPGPES
ncbi:MAG: helix-turn-helix domain-containing protein [Acidimicrobiales bacterium]